MTLQPIEVTSFYHIILRAEGEYPLFELEKDRAFLLDFLKKAFAENGIRAISYCLMSDHIHLAVTASAPSSIRAALDPAMSQYLQYTITARPHVARLWDPTIICCNLPAELLTETIRLIETHPSRAGLVETPECWPWSSAPFHIGIAIDPLISADVSYTAPADWKSFLREPANNARVGMILSAISKCRLPE